MLGAANEVLGTSVHASLTGNTLHGAPSAWLDQVRAAWTDIVRADARAKVEQQGKAKIREHMLVLEADQAQAVKDEMTAALAAIDAATTVAEINALKLPTWAGIGYMQHEDGTWEPYPETCPWTLAEP